MSCMLATAAKAGENRFESNVRNTHARHEMRARAQTLRPRVILVEVTGSRIPQRVVIMGSQVNSASPLFVVQGDALTRGGATTVSGILSIDPSITFGGGRGL